MRSRRVINPRLKNERTPDDYPVCPCCRQPIRPGQGAGLREEYALHVGCEPRPQPAAATPPLTASRQRTILYIDDDEANLRLVEMLLTRHPAIEFLSDGRGRSGLELARARRPDLILLDLGLPDIAGAQVLTAIREDQDIAQTPVIVLTAEADPRVASRLLSAGAEAYLVKPLNVDEFFAAIEAHLPTP
jgi:CheY-like chemotaxis protein